jgi:MoaA/NifB/PqqE/SkfB family radical SAM enzyme
MSYRFKLLISYLKCLSPGKIINYILLRTALFASRLTGRIILWGKPFAVTFETVSGCNLRCSGCETGSGVLKRQTGLMNTDQFVLALNKLPSSIFHLNLHAQGEPLLHKSIDHFIRLARQRHMFVSMSTNGTLLDVPTAKNLINAGLNHIIISLDGFDQDSYSAYRAGGDFTTVINNIKELIRLRKKAGRKTPLVEIQTVVTKYNENHLSSIKHIAQNIGADFFKLKTAYVPDLSSPPHYFPVSKKLTRYYTNKNGTLSTLRKTPRFCFRQRSSLVVLNNMDVVPCCFDKNAEWKLGSLISDEFKNFMNNEKSMQLHKMLRSQKPPCMCINCI